MTWPVWAVLLGTAPVVLLATLVLRDRPLLASARTAVGVAAVLALLAYGLDATALGVAVLRGTWTGVWILAIVLPALLLFEVLDRSGALQHLSLATDRLAPTDGRALLLLAFALPSFLQGAAGFGAPIAMSAPLLVRRGMAPVAAVAACLIGYQWSVTFGSMGSSYFMAEATARLSEADAREFALRAGVVLGLNAILSGLLVLTRGRRSRGDTWRALVIGSAMALTLVVVVSAQPALGSTAAGLVGLAVCWLVLPGRGRPRPAGGDLLAAALPYAVLTVTATIAFALPPVRALLDRVPELAPVLPGADAAFGFSTPESAVTPVFRPLLHPLPYVLLAVAVGLVVYRRRGWWPAGSTHESLRHWSRRARSVGPPIVWLAVLAAIMADAGMIAAVAQFLSTVLGLGFLAVSAPLGTLGTVLTGSTTASNALFSSLQAEVAAVLGISATILLSGQTAGGNIGNALSPAVIAVGTTAAGASRREGEVLRRNLGGAGILMLAVIASVVAQAWLARGG